MQCFHTIELAADKVQGVTLICHLYHASSLIQLLSCSQWPGLHAQHCSATDSNSEYGSIPVVVFT